MKRILFALLVISISTSAIAQQKFTEPSYILAGHNDDVDALAVSYSTNLIASGSWDRNINLYSADSPFALIRPLLLNGHIAPVTTLRFNKTGKLLASGGGDFMVKIWDSVFRVRNLEGHHGNINCLLFDNTSKYLFSGSDDKTIIAWDISSGKPFRTISCSQPVNSMAMLGNDPRLLFVAGAEPKIKVINLSTLQVTKTFDGHTDIVNSIDISKNNLYLISGSNDKTARIWDIKTGKEIRKLAVDCWKVTAVAFTDDSKYAVTGCNDGSIKIWEVETGKLISNTESSGNGVRNISFLKNMKHVAVASLLRGSTTYGLRIWPTGIFSQLNKPAISFSKSDSAKMKFTKADSLKLNMLPANLKTNRAESSKRVHSKADSLRLKIVPAPVIQQKQIPKK